MKSLIAVATLLAASAMPAVAQDAAALHCSSADNLCPSCSGSNITDATGVEYIITCDYVIRAESEVQVGGDNSIDICMDACQEARGCFGINFGPSGDCYVQNGAEEGFDRRVGFTNLLRQAESTISVTSTSHVQITTTIFASGATHLTPVTISFTTPASHTTSAPSQSTAECDLELTNLCPACDQQEVGNKGGALYRIVCENDLHSSNGTYSVQEWTSPEGCLAECDQLEFCHGATYYDDRNCELMKGDDIYPTSQSGYTAFVPVLSTTSAATPSTTKTPDPLSSTLHAITPTLHAGNASKTLTKPTPPPTHTTRPADSMCRLNALSCPACDGAPYVDKLNQTYTVVCDVAPTCDSVAKTRDGLDSVEQCLETCDQDATCLAVMWYPRSYACNLCQQGMDEGVGTNPPYILLVADMDGDNGNVSATATTSSNPPHSTNPLSITRHSTSGSSTSTVPIITDFPSPFPTSVLSLNPLGPVGPVSFSSFPKVSSKTYGITNNLTSVTSVSAGFHSSTTSVSAEVTNTGSVTCPEYDNDVYPADDGDYFAVACESMFMAAHSRFLSASDFAACVAACTEECGGVQFGYSTRCGLYTGISTIGPGQGWTAAARITGPTPFTTPTAASTSTTTVAPFATTTTIQASPSVSANGTRPYGAGPAGYGR